MKKKIKCRWCGCFYMDSCQPEISFCCRRDECCAKNVKGFLKGLRKQMNTKPPKKIEKLEESHIEYVKAGGVTIEQKIVPNQNTIIAKINEIIDRLNVKK